MFWYNVLGAFDYYLWRGYGLWDAVIASVRTVQSAASQYGGNGNLYP